MDTTTHPHPGNGRQAGPTTLAEQAERMRRELRALLPAGADLMDDLRELRTDGRDSEGRHRPRPRSSRQRAG